MRRDGQSVFVEFPKQLMSTARSSVSMGLEFGREIVNMYATADGAGSKRNGVVKVGEQLPLGQVVCGLFSFMKVGVGVQVIAVGSLGKVYRLNGTAWVEIGDGLNPLGVVRGVEFAGRLVLVNGYDPMKVWDGSTLADVSEVIPDVGGSLTYVNPTTFTILSDAAFYSVGTVVKATLATGVVTGTVASSSQSGAVTSVVLGSGVLNATLSAVAYTAKPPILAGIAVAHDRVWGFGKGPLGSGLSTDVDRTRVYYTHGVNNPYAWRDAEGVVPSINLADKSAGADEVMAMAVVDGMTVFLLRNSVQVWTGSTPGADGDFGWQKTMPVGCVHGGLMVALPNDLAFVTRTGVRTLSRSLQTEQVHVSDVGSEIDPTLAAAVRVLEADPAAYKAVGVVRCEAQNWFGVCLGDKTVVFQVGNSGRGWVVFDGAFAGTTARCAASDGSVYLAKGGQVYRYDTSVYADDGEPIVTRWWTPWMRLGKPGKWWANRYVEVVSARGVPMGLRVRRYRNLDDGDGWVADITAQTEPDYWDRTDWDAGLFDNVNPAPDVVRDRFVADEMALALESANTLGPLTVLGMKIYGVSER
ncbi:MAG: hypothetical protein WAZ18_07260 [Alphaproteobacteria bacterium]